MLHKDNNNYCYSVRGEQRQSVPLFLSSGLTLCCVLFAVCSALCLPHKLNAQPQAQSVTYLDSIIEDEEGGKISFPSFVFVEPVTKEIYTIDSIGRIIIYTPDFFPIFTLNKKDGIETPQGLTVDTDGNLYIAQSATKDNPRHRISVYNACLKWERDIYMESFEGAYSFSPYHLAAVKNGDLFVAGLYFPGVLMINNHGKLLDILSPEEEGKKVKLNNVTVDKAGRIYLVSEEESHIYVYDENRKFLFKYGEKGGTCGKLSSPQAVGIDDRNGRMFVVDYMRHTVTVYSKDGQYLSEFGGLGWGEGWFQYPRDISIDTKGRIFVADTFNNRIEVFQANE
jgi:DNA-binding beta-propeller fold protein YncE